MESIDGVLGVGARIFSSVADWVAAHPIPATAIALVTTALGAWNNQKNRATTIFGHSMQAITHMDSRWESPDLRESRRIASAFLHRHLSAFSPACVAGASTSEDIALTAVLNFLEAVGAFVKSGAIGHRIAWQLFGSSAQHFVEAAETQLRDYRTPHETIYTELQYLYLIARVEEARRDWPMAWLWKRTASASLTWQSRRPRRRDWFLVPCTIIYAVVLGRVQTSRTLPPLFSKPELIQTLSRDAQVGS